MKIKTPDFNMYKKITCVEASMAQADYKFKNVV